MGNSINIIFVFIVKTLYICNVFLEILTIKMLADQLELVWPVSICTNSDPFDPLPTPHLATSFLLIVIFSYLQLSLKLRFQTFNMMHIVAVNLECQ